MVRCFIAKENLHSSVLVTLRLEHEKKLAEVSKKEMQYVMGNVAHDLKTPMQAICLGIDDIGRLSKPDDITTVDTRSDDVLSEIHGMLQILRDTSNFMVLSINRAVDFTKTSSGVELKPNIESVDIPEILEWTVNCMRRLQDHVPIVLDPFPAGMGSRVFTDRGWLIDNMLCLLSNAVKYTMQGEVHVFVAIEDRPFPLGSQKWLKVTVMDTGIGIPSERKSALFQPFSQAQRMAGGTGLGLYSLSKRMNALGGDCGVCDRGDGTEGSCFWFCFHYIPDFLDEDDVTEDIRSRYRFSATPPLPSHNTETNGVEVGLSPSLEVERPPSLDVSIAEEFDNHKQDDVVKGSGTSDIESSHMISGVLDESVDLSARILDMKLIPPSPPLHCAPAAPPESEDIRGGEENESYDKTYEVLLVDDSHVIQKTLMRSLERRGFRVTLANHGQDGLNKMKENTYGVVLLDMNMPVMDGFECCRRLREHESSKRQLLGSNKHQFVIGISANNTESTEAYAMEAGMDAFLTKPFSVDSFCELYQKHGAFL
ncbi:dhkJ [Symbiodinium microadriaticum]|nr:dhkJ [Symbiodinium microadriaticum]